MSITNTYYEITATLDGETEVLFGSFDKSDVTYELTGERDSWKGEGYKKIKIVSRQTEEVADAEVYGDDFKHVTVKNAKAFAEADDQFAFCLELLDASANDSNIDARVNDLEDQFEALLA